MLQNNFKTQTYENGNLETDCIFEKVAKEWLTESMSRLKESSIVRYNNILHVHLIPNFGEMPMSNISRKMVIEFANELYISGKEGTNKGLAARTINSILSVLKSIFQYAANNLDIRTENINKIFIKHEQQPLKILSIHEQKQLNTFLLRDKNLTNVGILLCLYTGIRIGELCALKWEDISEKEQCINIRHTMQRVQKSELADISFDTKTHILISSPKSSCSIRTIPIPDNIFSLLINLRTTNSAFLLTGSPEHFIEPRTMQNRFKNITKQCGINDTNFHILRHTFATRCVELGFDIKSLSEILGHASVNITLNRYVHPSMELKRKNMELLSNVISQ